MLIAKALHFGDWADDAPLIYPTLVKSASFAVVLAFFKILEEAVVGLYHGKSFQDSIADLAGGTLKGILMLALLRAYPLLWVHRITKGSGRRQIGADFLWQQPLLQLSTGES